MFLRSGKIYGYKTFFVPSDEMLMSHPGVASTGTKNELGGQCCSLHTCKIYGYRRFLLRRRDAGIPPGSPAGTKNELGGQCCSFVSRNIYGYRRFVPSTRCRYAPRVGQDEQKMNIGGQCCSFVPWGFTGTDVFCSVDEMPVCPPGV